MTDSRDADANRLAAQSIAQDDPTGWFEHLYAQAALGAAIVPWDRGEPNALLVAWIEQQELQVPGKRVLVVGSGLGRDTEYIASHGFGTTGFDISPTAVQSTRERFPESAVDYVVADLLHPPAEWAGGFDLVVESVTVQSMPLSVRAEAIKQVRRLVAPGGQLLVIAESRAEDEVVAGPPWPLTRSEIDSFAADGLRTVHIEQISRPEAPSAYRWRAVFSRDPH